MPIEATWKHSIGITRAGKPLAFARAVRAEASACRRAPLAPGLHVVEQRCRRPCRPPRGNVASAVFSRAPDVRHLRIGVGHRARRADGGAAAAARAQVRLDLDVVAVGAGSRRSSTRRCTRCSPACRSGCARRCSPGTAKKLRLLELAHQRRRASAPRAPARADRRRARDSPAAASWQLDQRLARQVEHQVEASPCAARRVREKSIAPIAPQAFTQSRCALHLARSIW